MSRWRLLSSACALIVGLTVSASARGQTRSNAGWVERWFSGDSVWSAPLSTSAPIATDSASIVASLTKQVQRGATINTTAYSVPVYVASATQARVRVQLDSYAPALQRAIDSVPIPSTAVPAAGGDAHLVVWQPATDSMWEFWRMHRTSKGLWAAAWAGVMTRFSQSPGYFASSTRGWGATATGLPLLGGLITPQELRSGRINHALAMAVPDTSGREFAYPAQRSDGRNLSPTAVPEGARFRLPANLDIASLRLPRATAILARAAQQYGIIVRDTAADVVFYAEAPHPGAVNPYSGLESLWAPSPNASEVMVSFPWSRLQVVRAPRTTM